MPAVNRYTEMPKPLMVNPIGFEEFMRVPVAQAETVGATSNYLSKIATEYNVDDRDLGQVSNWVGELDSKKEKVVNQISTNGVDGKTIEDVLKLKRDRDLLYKSKINQAEENKKRIDEWKATLDRMVLSGQISAQYADKIREKEMGNKWQGTFDPTTGAPVKFDLGYGAKYVDVDNLIRERLSEAAKHSETVSKTWAGKTDYGEEVIGDKTFYMQTTSEGGSKSTQSNEKNIDNAIQGILQDAKTPGNELFEFVNYADLGKDELANRISQVKGDFLTTVKDIRSGTKTKQLGSEKTNTSTNGLPMYEELDKTVINYAWKPELENSTSGGFTTIYKTVEKAQQSEDKGFFTEVLNLLGGPGYNVWKKTKNLFKAYNSIEKTTDSKKVALNSVPRILNKLVELGQIDKNTLDKDLKSNDPKVLNKLLGDVEDYMDSQENKFVDVKGAVGDWAYTFWGEKISNDPVAAFKDLSGISRQMFSYDDREAIGDRDEVEKIRSKMSKGEGKIVATIPFGSPLSNDPITKKHIPGVVGGLIVQIDGLDKEGKARNIIISPPTSAEQNPLYIEMQEMDALAGNLYPGQSTQAYEEIAPSVWQGVRLIHDDSNVGNYLLRPNGKQELEGERPYIPGRSRVVGPQYFKYIQSIQQKQ